MWSIPPFLRLSRKKASFCDPELEKLAAHRLSRAQDAFAEGDYLLTKKAFKGAVDRFYYSAFYAARALLAIRELDSSRHSGVISLFQKHLVKSGLVSTESEGFAARG